MERINRMNEWMKMPVKICHPKNQTEKKLFQIHQIGTTSKEEEEMISGPFVIDQLTKLFQMKWFNSHLKIWMKFLFLFLFSFKFKNKFFFHCNYRVSQYDNFHLIIIIEYFRQFCRWQLKITKESISFSIE